MHDISSKMCFVKNFVTSKLSLQNLEIYSVEDHPIGPHFEPTTTRVRVKSGHGDIFDKCNLRRNVADSFVKQSVYFSLPG